MNYSIGKEKEMTLQMIRFGILHMKVQDLQ